MSIQYAVKKVRVALALLEREMNTSNKKISHKPTRQKRASSPWTLTMSNGDVINVLEFKTASDLGDRLDAEIDNNVTVQDVTYGDYPKLYSTGPELGYKHEVSLEASNPYWFWLVAKIADSEMFGIAELADLVYYANEYSMNAAVADKLMKRYVSRDGTDRGIYFEGANWNEDNWKEFIVNEYAYLLDESGIETTDEEGDMLPVDELFPQIMDMLNTYEADWYTDENNNSVYVFNN